MIDVNKRLREIVNERKNGRHCVEVRWIGFQVGVTKLARELAEERDAEKTEAQNWSAKYDVMKAERDALQAKLDRVMVAVTPQTVHTDQNVRVICEHLHQEVKAIVEEGIAEKISIPCSQCGAEVGTVVWSRANAKIARENPTMCISCIMAGHGEEEGEE